MCAPVAQSALSHIINGIEISKPRVNCAMKILATRINKAGTGYGLKERTHKHTYLHAYEHKIFMTAHIYNRRCIRPRSPLLFIYTHTQIHI